MRLPWPGDVPSADAPALARRRAVAAPIPLLAPVTIATVPVNFKAIRTPFPSNSRNVYSAAAKASDADSARCASI